MPGQGFWGSTKPPAGTPLDRSHPLAPDFGWLLAEGSGLPRPFGFEARPTVTTGTPAWKPGRGGGGALSFASLVLGYGDVNIFDGLTQLSVIMSVRPASLSQVAGVLNKRNGAGGQDAVSLGFGYNAASQFSCAVGLGAAVGAVYNFSVAGWSTSAYQCAAAVWNDSLGAGNRWRAWRDGVPLAKVSQGSDAGGPIADTTSPLELGRVNNASLFFSGELEYVYLYRRALTAAEVQVVTAQPYAMFTAPFWRRNIGAGDLPGRPIQRQRLTGGMVDLVGGLRG